MLETINLSDVLSYAVQFLSFFVLSFAGAFTTEIHNANTLDDYEFTAYKVVYGTIVASLISFAVHEYYLGTVISHWEIMILISFILGLIGYELFMHLSSLAGILSLFKSYDEIKKDLPEPKKTTNPNDVSDKPKEINLPNIKINKH